MDKIDSRELVDSLQKIVETFHKDITPFAVGVVGKLAENYMKLVTGDKEDREDTEIMSTALGCVQAINRILSLCIEAENLSQDLFPQMEKVLINMCNYLICEEGSEEHREDGLTTISQLVRGMPQLTENLWHLFNNLLSMIGASKLNDYFHNVVVVM